MRPTPSAITVQCYNVDSEVIFRDHDDGDLVERHVADDSDLLDELHVLRVDAVDELLAPGRFLRLQHAQLRYAREHGDERERHDVVVDGLHHHRLPHLEHERRLHGRPHRHHEQLRHRRNAGPRRSRRRRHVAEFGFAEGASRQNLQTQLHPRETAVLVHLPDHDGHTKQPAENAHPLRNLPIHHGPLPVLPTEPAALAELDPALAVLQRLFRQGAEDSGQAGEGLVLEPAPRLREHVRKRVLPPTAEALQRREERSDEAVAQESFALGGQQ